MTTQESSGFVLMSCRQEALQFLIQFALTGVILRKLAYSALLISILEVLLAVCCVSACGLWLNAFWQVSRMNNANDVIHDLHGCMPVPTTIHSMLQMKMRGLSLSVSVLHSQWH